MTNCLPSLIEGFAKPAENFLLETHSGELRLLDWEYAGMGDCYFDLANLSAQHDFGPAEDQALLQSYFGDAGLPRLLRLAFHLPV